MFLCSTRFLERTKNTYVWETRKYLPSPAQTILDKCLRVDPGDAFLCTSNNKDSVRVDEAVATYDDVDYNVEEMMDMIWICGNGESIEFNLQRVLGHHGVLVDSGSGITLRVKYTGHRNIPKRISPQTYTVRYEGDATDVARFPPYPASDAVKKGLGVVKITSAMRHDGVSCLREARQSAGLRGKFYNDLVGSDVSDTPDPLVPNVMNFLDESERILEDLQVKVDTSKGPIVFNPGCKRV